MWETYREQSAIPSAGEFITRRELAKLYHDLPEPKLVPANAEGRALSNQDIANVFGVNIDGLVSGMLDNIAMHGKPYFIQLVKQSAEAKPNLFRGFTEEKIAQVYDNILAQSRMRPDVDIATQKILQQMEGVRQDLISLKMRHSLTPDEEKGLHAWIDNAVGGRGKIIGEVAPPVAKPINWKDSPVPVPPDMQERIQALINKLPEGTGIEVKSVSLNPALARGEGGYTRELGRLTLSAKGIRNFDDVVFHELGHGFPYETEISLIDEIKLTSKKYFDNQDLANAFSKYMRGTLPEDSAAYIVLNRRFPTKVAPRVPVAVQHINIQTTGTAYDKLLKDPAKYLKEEGMVGEIVMMTPDEYFTRAAKATDTPLEEMTTANIVPEKVDRMVKALQGKEQFPMPVIAEKVGQEGRHRMLAIKKAFGEARESPVLVVSKATGRKVDITEIAPMPEDWIAKVGKTKITETGEQIEASIDYKNMIVTFRDEASMNDPLIRNHEIAHILEFNLPSAADKALVKKYSDVAKAVGVITDEHIRMGLHREMLIVNLGEALTDPSMVDPRILGVFRQYFRDVKPAGIPSMVGAEADMAKVGALQKRLAAPPKAPKAMVSPEEWKALRQAALDDANKDYHKTFADYTNETILGGVMKMVYPYWTYHSYRWFYLGRTALRHPGLPVAWGKYQNYGENGYMPTFFPDIEMNPFVGSVLGTTFTLTRFDFSSYYNNLGWAGEMLDYSQRLGFFPGAHVMIPIALSPYLSGRPAELGEITPPIARSGINAFVGSNIPLVADAAKWLKDKIFHENFHEYYTATILSDKQLEAGGKLLIDPDTGEPVTGVDIWFKRLRKEKLTEEEQRLWDESYREAAGIGILRSQFPQFRLRTEEYKEAYKQVTQLIEQELGMSEAFQKELWKNHQRPTDVLGSDYPLDLRMAMDELWQWKIMMGRGTILMPPDASDLRALVDDYLKTVKNYQRDRVKTQVDFNNRFIFHETTTDPLNGGEWRQEYANNWTAYTTKVDNLKDPATREGKKYADAVYALTPEGRQKAFERLGFNIPPSHPLDEAMELYFEIELEKKLDPLSGEEDWDYLTFWLKREAVRMALTEEQRAEFDQYIRRYQTPMEEVFRYAYNTYIRGYYATNRIIFQTFTEDEKALIKEFFARATTRERREQIQDVVRADGRKLISQYNTKIRVAREDLRTVSPYLDFYLYAFGYGTKPSTPESRAMVDRWEADRQSIFKVIG